MKKRENCRPWWRFALPPLIAVAQITVVLDILSVFHVRYGSIS